LKGGEMTVGGKELNTTEDWVGLSRGKEVLVDTRSEVVSGEKILYERRGNRNGKE
jgi:hypothetical protein